VPLYFVRHAKAGERSRWSGPDEERPLSKNGREQARGLAATLGQAPVTRILSSPYVRCVQTVEPLAEEVGVPVEADDSLAEGMPFEPVLKLLTVLPDHAVLCSHGDLIPDVVDALMRRGMRVVGEPDWRKGAHWVLERDAHGDVVSAHAVAPPQASQLVERKSQPI
jgi:8-oxo-dGTP diphosphatase